MLDSAKQVVQRELSKEEKRKEFLMVGVCFFIFIVTYYLSGLLGFLSIFGYLMAIAVVVFLYRMVRQFVYQYTYRVKDGSFTIIQAEGKSKRNPKVLCSFALEDIEALLGSSPDLKEYQKVYHAAASETNPSNRCIAFKQNEQMQLVIITPDVRIWDLLEKSQQAVNARLEADSHAN